MPAVNVWSLIHQFADKDAWPSDDCYEFMEKAKAPWFGNEFTAELDEFGTLTIRVFNCHDEWDGDSVEIKISRRGDIVAKRQRHQSGVCDERKVSF
jgi:hypothetical protein